MPKIRYYKAKKLKSGRTKIAGKRYRIVPLKDPKKYPKGTAMLIPSRENNPVAKKRKKKRSLPPRDPKTGKFRKRKKRKKKYTKKKRKKKGNPNNCPRRRW